MRSKNFIVVSTFNALEVLFYYYEVARVRYRVGDDGHAPRARANEFSMQC